MKIKNCIIDDDVSVNCEIGELSIPDSYSTIGYFKVTGTYKVGSAGSADAYHIAGMMAYAQARYFQRHWLVDLSCLSYVWGDEMDMVFEMGGDPHVDKTSLVVGPGCMAAISTLADPTAKPRDCLNYENTFENIEDAYTYLVKCIKT